MRVHEEDTTSPAQRTKDNVAKEAATGPAAAEQAEEERESV